MISVAALALALSMVARGRIDTEEDVSTMFEVVDREALAFGDSVKAKRKRSSAG